MRFVLLTAAVLAGCRDGDPTPIPDMVMMVLQLNRGGYVSLLVELPRPGSSPTVRMTPGVLSAGPGWAHRMAFSSVEDNWTLDIEDISHEQLHSVSLSGEFEIEAIHRDHAVLSVEDQYVQVSVQDGAMNPLEGSFVAGGMQEWRGPFDGFSIGVVNDRLELLLPRSAGKPIHLLQGVDSILGSWWLRRDHLPEWEQTTFDKNFKQVGVLAAGAGTVDVDGDMTEWRSARALPVDSPSQVSDGVEHWEGARDSSFGVAARVDLENVFLGVRIRDDSLLDSRDQLEILFEDRRIRIPVDVYSGEINGEGWHAVFTPPRHLGVGIEIGIDATVLEQQQALPLIVQYIDYDSDNGPTILGTSAWPDLVSLGVAELAPPLD